MYRCGKSVSKSSNSVLNRGKISRKSSTYPHSSRKDSDSLLFDSKSRTNKNQIKKTSNSLNEPRLDSSKDHLCATKSTKNSSVLEIIPTHRELNLTDKNVKGKVLVIFLPYITNTRRKYIKQPFLINVNVTKFHEFGFKVPFTCYFDEVKNQFQVKFGDYPLNGQIIASSGKIF